MDETSHHQNTHWRESIQMQRVQLFRNHIIRHMLTHSGEKLHECTECKKSFSQAGNLSTHMLFHTGGIPTFVHSATSNSHKLENWKSTYSLTVMKSHTVELQSAKSHSAILEPWADICLCTLGRSSTLEPSVKNHWSKWNSEEPFAQPLWRKVAQMHRV